MGAALVMAALRTALRTVPGELGPAQRVTRAAESMTFGPKAEPLFVTLFHGRLEVETGRLRYVDAGHGYCLLRRAGGELERLGERSMPVGLGLGEEFVEGEVRLEPGDALLVVSDGLVEVGEEPVKLEELGEALEVAGSAAEVVTRLLEGVSEHLADDVTVLVLRRLAVPDRRPAGPDGTRSPGPDGHVRSTEWQDEPLVKATFQYAPLRLPVRASPLIEEETRGRLFLRFLTVPGSGGAVMGAFVAVVLVSFLEWRLGAGAAGLSHPDGRTLLLAVAAPLVAGLPWYLVVACMGYRAVKIAIAPLPVLVARARSIAAGEWVPIPYQDREDEIGDLAMALREWQEAAAVREVLLRSAPVGICRIDATGAVVDSNRAAQATLGYAREELQGRELLDLVHPEDRHLGDQVTAALAEAGKDRVMMEARLRCGDGSWLWCVAVVAPVVLEDGVAGGYVVILEDVSARKRQAEWAAAVQREMLPSRALELEGYELAGGCLPAQEVAGDLYDWVDRSGGRLDLTVADVMGKGIGAALVMSALRTALRTAPAELGPAQRVARAAESMTFGAEVEGMFVTLFHGRLELASGRLRYVDAGHGYCLVRRADGRVERLGQRSLPLGVRMGERFREGEVRLEPGDVLMVCSDGLVEVDGESVPVEELAADLEAGTAAGEMVRRLLGRVSDRLTDDVTAVVLQRQHHLRSPAALLRVK